MEEYKQIHFGISRITTPQFAIIDDVFNESEGEIRLANKLGFKLEAENKTIVAVLIIRFTQNGKTILQLEVRCHFVIDAGSWKQMLEIAPNKIKAPKEFLRHLGAFTAGTARGVLYCRTENTLYNKFVLPPLNVNEMIKEDQFLGTA